MNLKKNAQPLSIALYLLVTFVIISIVYTNFQPSPAAAVEITSLNDLQKEALAIVLDLNKYLQSLSLLVISAIGAIILKENKAMIVSTYFSLATLFVCLITSIISIYFGYILNLKIVEMLSNDFFDVRLELIQQPRRWQFYFFLISIIGVGLFFIDHYSKLLKK